jgi:hypothetical protein
MKRILLWLKSFFNKKEIVGYSNVDIILELAEEHGSLIPHGFDGNVNGYDTAIVGITDDGQLVYSKEKMVEITAVVGDMSAEDAWEFLEYNTFCAYVGEKTPLYITTY